MPDIDVWEDRVSQICGNFRTTRNPQIPFIGDIQRRNHDGLEVAHIQTNASRVQHPAGSLQNDQHCFLILQTHGTMGLRHAQGEFVLRPGEMALLDSGRPYDMLPQGLMQQMSVHLPRSLLAQVLPRDSGFAKLSQGCISGQILRNILQQLACRDEAFGAQQGDGQALQGALSALLHPALKTLTDAEDGAPLRMLAEQHIRRLLPDYRLTPERLAEEMAISRRSLYRLFESEGQSLSRYILGLRIERAAAELSLDAESSVTEIAFRWGFSDVSRFSRAFKRLKGMSPREWRQQPLSTLPRAGQDSAGSR